MKNKMQFLEISSLMYFVMRSTFIGIGLNTYLHYSEVDTYLAIILGTLLGIIPFFLIINISKKYKSISLPEIINKVFKNKIGKIVNTILILFVSFYSIIIFYDLINFISSEYLYSTPNFLIGIVILIPLIYLSLQDLKTLGRTSVILFFISIIFYLFSIIGISPHIKFNNLLPIMNNNFENVIRTSLVYIGYTVLPLLILLIIPRENFEGNKKFEKSTFITYILVNMILFLTSFSVMGVLGIDLSLLYQYPDYQVLRRIQAGGFIQRTESILAIQWLLCMFMMLAIFTYYIFKSSIVTFKIKNKKVQKSIKILTPILILFISLNIFKNNTIATNFEIEILPILTYIFLLTPLLFIYIIIIIKKLVKK